jgi:hypothetical protein
MPVLSTEEVNNLLATDAEFRAEFISNPKPTLAQLGLVYPDSTKVTVVESKPNAIALIVGTEDIYPPAQIAAMPPQVAAVIKRSFSDAEFKALLVKDPKEAIYLETGYRVPESVTVTTYEATKDHVYVPIVETAKDSQSEELSDLELEQVAGGKSKAGSAIAHFFTSTVPAAATTVYKGTVANATTIEYAGRAVQFTAQAGSLIAEGLG